MESVAADLLEVQSPEEQQRLVPTDSQTLSSIHPIKTQTSQSTYEYVNLAVVDNCFWLYLVSYLLSTDLSL